MADNDNENENEKPLTYADEEEPESGLFRWMSAVVVLLAVAGFCGLAWYAYKSGGEAVDDKDVEIVKADKTPVKEVPANPGGMPIPNQDKTVYSLINGGKTEKPTVERVLPAPEEPVIRAGGTETWMSDKIKKKINGEDGNPDAQPPVPATSLAENDSIKKAEQFNPARASDDSAQESPMAGAALTKAAPSAGDAKPDAGPAAGKQNGPALAPPAASQVSQPPASPPSPPPPPPSPPSPPPARKTAPAAAAPPAQPDATPPKGPRVQLGAFKSEAEANATWAKIAKRLKAVQGKQHYVARADLGAKGIFYRLQLAPFASAGEAQEFCDTLADSDQGCLVVKAK